MLQIHGEFQKQTQDEKKTMLRKEAKPVCLVSGSIDVVDCGKVEFNYQTQLKDPVLEKSEKV